MPVLGLKPVITAAETFSISPPVRVLIYNLPREILFERPKPIIVNISFDNLKLTKMTLLFLEVNLDTFKIFDEKYVTV